MEVTDRKGRVAEVKKQIEDELKTLSIEDLEDILHGLMLARVYKSAHVPQELS